MSRPFFAGYTLTNYFIQPSLRNLKKNVLLTILIQFVF